MFIYHILEKFKNEMKVAKNKKDYYEKVKVMVPLSVFGRQLFGKDVEHIYQKLLCIREYKYR